ncbi:MAG: hypothetical protein WDN69_28545 [Aliidongia sp.]
MRGLIWSIMAAPARAASIRGSLRIVSGVGGGTLAPASQRSSGRCRSSFSKR